MSEKVNLSTDERYAVEWIETPKAETKGHWRVFNKRTDSRIATCYLRDNAEIVCAALNRSNEPLQADDEETFRVWRRFGLTDAWLARCLRGQARVEAATSQSSETKE